MSIRLYGCTTWTLTKQMEKKVDSNYSRMLRAILNKSWRQHPKKQQLYGHQQLITKTIKIRRTRYVRHCWRGRDELISDVLLWAPSHGWAKAGRPAWTYIQQLCADTGCSLEDLSEAMDNREVWRERVRNIPDMMMMMMIPGKIIRFVTENLSQGIKAFLQQRHMKSMNLLVNSRDRKPIRLNQFGVENF